MKIKGALLAAFILLALNSAYLLYRDLQRSHQIDAYHHAFVTLCGIALNVRNDATRPILTACHDEAERIEAALR